MSLRQDLIDQMKQAMRDRDQVKLDTIRFVIARVKKDEIDLKREMTDQEVVKLIKHEAKSRQEAIKQIKSGGRDQLASQEQAKLDILLKFLPEQISDEELEQIVSKVISNAPSKDFGPLMGLAMKAVGDRADGKRVNEMVKKVLS